jgi:hypothetical protein
MNVVLVQVTDAINTGDLDRILSNISPQWFRRQTFEIQSMLESLEFDAQQSEDQTQ